MMKGEMNNKYDTSKDVFDNPCKNIKRSKVNHPKTKEHKRSLFKQTKTVTNTNEKYCRIGTFTDQSSKSVSKLTIENSCFFCDKASKYRANKRSRCQLNIAGKKLIDSIRNNDGPREARLLTEKIDAFGLENTSRLMYHKTCYLDHNNRLSRINRRERCPLESVDCYTSAKERAFKEVFKFTKEQLLEKQTMMKLSDLRKLLISKMISLGVTKVSRSTKCNFRRKIEAEFGQSLMFVTTASNKVLVFPRDLSVQKAVEDNYLLKKQIKQLNQEKNKTAMLEQVAKVLHEEIKSQAKSVSLPPQTEELKNVTQYIPASLRHFITLMITGIHATDEDHQTTVVDSVCQDIMYAAHHGRMILPKHVLLASAVKTLTGNIEVVKILNKLGHCISRSKLSEIDLSICLHKLSGKEADDAILPESIQPNVMVGVAWDNIDRLEATLTGEGTSHRVNGIIVQKPVFGPSLPPKKMTSLTNKSKLSLDLQPKPLPLYSCVPRVGPGRLSIRETLQSQAKLTASMSVHKQKNLLWILARLQGGENQKVCGWSGFNVLTSPAENTDKDNLEYLPTINAPATEFTTVNEILKKSQQIQEALDLPGIVVTLDQALYAKAAQISWAHPDKYGKIVLRLGAFHTACTLISIIGKRFQDAGLKDICVEAHLVAENSIAAVVEGRHYNRSVRVHKLIYEAILRLLWDNFLKSIDDNPITKDTISSGLLDIQKLQENVDAGTFKETMASTTCSTRLIEAFERHLNHMRCENGPLSSLWVSYIDLVAILLALIRASREGDWDLHLAAIRAMIPWCFAYDNQNYARYLSVYFGQMIALPLTHPEVHRYMHQGGFSVQQTEDAPFARVPVDQALEETVNKDTQTAGGTKGFSLNPTAVQKFYLTAEYRSKYLRVLREITDTSTTLRSGHKDMQTTRLKRDETDVCTVVDLLDNGWINPFNNTGDELQCLSSAAVAPEDVKKDMLTAYDVGESSYETFRESRLQQTNEEMQQGFFDRLPKKKLKTFTSMTKQTKVKTKSDREVTIKADKNVFAHAVIIAQVRKLDMREVFAHPLGPLPFALATPDGMIRKTNKAVLARTLEKSATLVQHVPGPSACIVDGMSLVHRVKADRLTFSAIARVTFRSILQEANGSKRVDVVFDQYKDMSIKSAERRSRGDKGVEFKDLAPNHTVKNWKHFLSNGTNKTNLVKFFVQEWQRCEYTEMLQCQELYVTCGSKCLRLSHESVSEVPELESDQEEADTRIILHVQHASEQSIPAVIVCADDTDILVLCLYFSNKVRCQIFLKRGTAANVRILDVNSLVSVLTQELCLSLPGLHAFTGCDTVSSFAGKGKVSALKLLQCCAMARHTFQNLGKNWKLNQALYKELETITCNLYGSKQDAHVNELRFKLFVAKKGDIESHQLPPCLDCLQKHMERANYQCAIWKRSLTPKATIPKPEKHGWARSTAAEQENLSVDWMKGLPAPLAVLELLSCTCRKCTKDVCDCSRNGLKCTELCGCKGTSCPVT